MAEVVEITYEEWRKNRTHSFQVGGIEVRVRYVSLHLLTELGEQLGSLLASIEDSGYLNKREVAALMRTALQVILPHVLVSPSWLIKALDDFTDDEIHRLYNIIMHARVKN
ncbi:MAG: hypothetical protein OXF22_09600 [Anaerolineaceae bacterium]|nr:hypothetical protein [Chloroflexota bacterium]MCY4009989.1 hypothetical protein [Anaerolineaceae bacterium]